MVSKKYANGVTNLTYLYDADSRLTNRWSQAVGNTAYLYDPSSNLTNIVYPHTTQVKLAFDALNRLTNMVDGSGTTVYGYSNGHLSSEDGPFSSDTVSYSYNSAGLRSQMTIAQASGTNWTTSYVYDAGDRLSRVTSPAGGFTNAFRSAGTLLASISMPGGNLVTNTYDSVGRVIDATLESPTHSILNEHGYQYDLASRRIWLSRTNSANATWAGTWTNAFNAASELTSALAYNTSGTAVTGEQWRFGYDAGWNMTGRGTGSGTNSYTANNLNEVTSDGSNAFSYDANGSRTNLALVGGDTISYTFDDENRLIAAQTDTKNTPTSQQWKTLFTYDGLSRLRQRVDYDNVGSGWNLVDTVQYLYDGALIVQERNGSGVPQLTYTRGIDLSGTLGRAGGIGGLLARSMYSGYSVNSSTFYHADGNGNITSLVNSSGTLQAKYQYDPFGRSLSSAGSLALANEMQFSSKPFVGASLGLGMYYYGYRFYDQSTQRWLNRDPLSDCATLLPSSSKTGGSRHHVAPSELWNQGTVFSVVGNDAINFVDGFGLFTIGVGIGGSFGAGLYFSGSTEVTASFNGINPLDWRLGGALSATPGTAVSTGIGASLGFCGTFSMSPKPEDWDGWSFGAGLSGAILGDLALGADFSNLPSGPDRLDGFIGTGVEIMPGTGLPLEAHVGGGYGYNGSFSPREIWHMIVGVFE